MPLSFDLTLQGYDVAVSLYMVEQTQHLPYCECYRLVRHQIFHITQDRCTSMFTSQLLILVHLSFACPNIEQHCHSSASYEQPENDQTTAMDLLPCLPPTAEDWTVLRPSIIELYCSKQNTARQIVETLRLHGYLVT